MSLGRLGKVSWYNIPNRGPGEPPEYYYEDRDSEDLDDENLDENPDESKGDDEDETENY